MIYSQKMEPEFIALCFNLYSEVCISSKVDISVFKKMCYYMLSGKNADAMKELFQSVALL